MYCGKCGFKNRDDASFCGSCGNKLAVVEVIEEQVESLENDDEVLEVDNNVEDNRNNVEAPQMVDPNIEDNIPGDEVLDVDDKQDSSVAQESNDVINNQATEQNNMINTQPMINNNANQEQSYTTIQTFNNNHTASSNKLLYIILIIMGLILIGLLVGVIFVINKPSSSLDTRTIMIYMAGCNLESEGGLASNDLEAILPEEIDLEKLDIPLTTYQNYRNAMKFASNDYKKVLESYNNKILENIENIKKEEIYKEADKNKLNQNYDYAIRLYSKIKDYKYLIVIILIIIGIITTVIIVLKRKK